MQSGLLATEMHSGGNSSPCRSLTQLYQHHVRRSSPRSGKYFVNENDTANARVEAAFAQRQVTSSRTNLLTTPTLVRMLGDMSYTAGIKSSAEDYTSASLSGEFRMSAADVKPECKALNNSSR